MIGTSSRGSGPGRSETRALPPGRNQTAIAGKRDGDTESPSRASRLQLWIGRVLSGLVILFLTIDGAAKLVPIAAVTDTLVEMGYPASAGMARGLGVLLLACTLLYAIPRSSILGAVLLTGYLGGAIASHLRIESPLFSHLLFGVYLGLMLWGGLYLRDSRSRVINPLIARAAN